MWDEHRDWGYNEDWVPEDEDPWKDGWSEETWPDEDDYPTEEEEENE